MNRNIILYVLIALLVVVGGTWYALSTRTDEGVRDELTEEEQDADMDDEDGESESGDADGDSASNGGTDTGTGTSVNGGTSDDSTINEGSASTDLDGNGIIYTGMGGTESVSVEKQNIASELSLQFEIVESIVTIIQLQLESGDISVDDASDLLGDMAQVVDMLEDTVEAYLVL
jgi:hypothetical protein